MSLTTSTLAENGRQLDYNGKLVSILLTPSRQVSLKLVGIFYFLVFLFSFFFSFLFNFLFFSFYF